MATRSGRWFVVLASLAALAGGATACAPARPPTTSLRLTMQGRLPPTAHVLFDDVPIGSLGFIVQHGVAMPPGRHRVTIEARGYVPWDVEVDAGPGGGLVRLPVALVRIPD